MYSMHMHTFPLILVIQFLVSSRVFSGYYWFCSLPLIPIETTAFR